MRALLLLLLLQSAPARAASDLQAAFLARAEAFINCSAGYNNDHGDIARVAIQRNPDPTKPIIRSDYNVRASPALDLALPRLAQRAPLADSGADCLLTA